MISTCAGQASLVSYVFSGTTTAFEVSGGAAGDLTGNGVVVGTPFVGHFAYDTRGGPASWDVGVGSLVMSGSTPAAWQFNALPIMTTPTLPDVATFYRDLNSINVQYNNQVFPLASSGLKVFLTPGGTVDADGNNNVGVPDYYLSVNWSGTINQIDVQVEGLAVPDAGNSAALLAGISVVLLGTLSTVKSKPTHGSSWHDGRRVC